MMAKIDNRSKIIVAVCTLFTVFFVTAGLTILKPVFEDKQQGTFTVDYCSRGTWRYKYFVGADCYGSFSTSDAVLINESPSNRTQNSYWLKNGDIINAELTSSGALITSYRHTVGFAVLLFFGGLIFSVFGVTTFRWSRRVAKDESLSKKDRATLLPPAFTETESKWSHIAFYLGLLSVFLVPAPLAILSGVISLTRAKRRNKQDTWRAWVGILMGSAFSLIAVYMFHYYS